MQSPSSNEKIAAALLHLAYLPGAIGVAAVVIAPAHAVLFLTLTGLWLFSLVAGTLFHPRSGFVESHLLEARAYHSRVFAYTAGAFLFLIGMSVFTLGASAALALAIVPAALIVMMLPTWKGAYQALQGDRFEYGLNRRVEPSAFHQMFQRQARAARAS